MNCKNCGIAVEDGKKFCPNCGAPLTDAAPAPEAVPDAPAPETPTPETEAPAAEMPSAPEVAPAPEAAPSPQPEPIPQPSAPDAAANPYSMPGNTIPGGASGGAVPPVGGMPYDPAGNPVPPMGQLPKKKKKTGLIVALILIPILLIVIVIGVIAGVGVSMAKKSEKTVDDYWNAHVNCDAEALADLCPDDFWSYISDTYDLTEEEAVAAMSLYMQDYADSLGGDLSYAWEQEGVTAGFGNASQLDTVREDTDRFGLKVSSGICVDVKCTVTGNDDTDEDEYSIWTIKIDGQWCSLSAMDDFDDLCDSEYADSAKYQAEYGDLMDTYWNAVFAADADTMSTLVPDSWWDLVDQEYGVQQADAETYLSEMLQEMVTSEFGEDAAADISVRVTDIDEYDDSDLEDLNSGLDTYGIAGDAAVDVRVTVTVDGEDTDTYVTLTQIGGQWYVYDAMYYYATACYSAGESAVG